MDIYPMLLVAGLMGLAVLAALGFIHAPGHHNHTGGQQGGHLHLEAHHGHVHHTPLPHSHGAHAHPVPGLQGHGAPAAGAHVHGAGTGQQGGTMDPDDASSIPRAPAAVSPLLWLLPLLSPVNWFSWMVGAGAGGALARALGGKEPVAALVALVGAVAFHLGVVKPIWALVFSFASQPARGLEGCMLQVVEAATAFNERGEGLVRVNIDGRSEDVLAQLTEGERATGLRIRRGDLLMIEDVDTRNGSCRVSRA